MKTLSASFFNFGLLQIVIFIISAFFSYFLLVGVALGGLGGESTRQTITYYIWIAFTLISVVTVALAPFLFLFALIAGYALRIKHPWGRGIGTATVILSFLQFPIGTFMGVDLLKQLKLSLDVSQSKER